jgi:hypothetical protein
MDDSLGFDSAEPAVMQLDDSLATAEAGAVPSLALRASGVYRYVRRAIPTSGSVGEDGADVAPAAAADPGLALAAREELRLDIDGRYPQMVLSGLVTGSLTDRLHWIANISASGRNTWAGNIWYKDGNPALLPHGSVSVTVVRSIFPSQRRAVVTFSGAGLAPRIRTYQFSSRYFRHLELEFDCAEGTAAVTSVNTGDHPNRPATLPVELLTMETIFRRAGFNVRKSGGDDVVPLVGAGANARWSDAEMHDAMQAYWSRFANLAQWSAWVFFASLHEQGTSLGGIMFDDIGPNHRQGTAIFENAFISQAPQGEANPVPWVRRMRFWTAVHETGHCFNLAHSWQKSLGVPWMPLVDEPEARSFMNYPYRVNGGQSAFFADFDYRFSNPELLFMRHAPERFVEMGAADWFDHHAFEQARISPEPQLALEVRVNRTKPLFEFLEPVVLELKLTNVTSEPQIVPDSVLSSADHMTIVVKKQGRPARQFLPYARYCRQAKQRVLAPGESLYESLFVSVDRTGWHVAEPGNYLVQVALHLVPEDVVSNPLALRVAPPHGYDEDVLAQDFFSDSVGRILTFDGSRFLEAGLDTLRDVTERFPGRRVALHAHIALANGAARDFKQLVLGEGPRQMTAAHCVNGAIAVRKVDVAESSARALAALTANRDVAWQTLGHVDYKYYADLLGDLLQEKGARKEAVQLQDALYEALSDTTSTSGIVQRVLMPSAKQRRERYAAGQRAA